MADVSASQGIKKNLEPSKGVFEEKRSGEASFQSGSGLLRFQRQTHRQVPFSPIAREFPAIFEKASARSEKQVQISRDTRGGCTFVSRTSTPK